MGLIPDGGWEVVFFAVLVLGANAHRETHSQVNLRDNSRHFSPGGAVVHHHKTPSPLEGGITEHAKTPAPETVDGTAEVTPASGGFLHRAKASDLWLPILVVLCCTSLIAFLSYHLCCKRRRGTRLSIAETSRTSIAALREGEWAKVVGTVVPAQEGNSPSIMHSPLQGVPCVRMNVTAEANGQVLARREEERDFYIRDESGAAVFIHASDVCWYHLRSVLQTTHVMENGAALPEACDAFLQGSLVSPLTGSEQALNFDETTIGVGATVVAVGVCIRMPRTGQLSLQPDTAVHKVLAMEKGEDLRKSLQESVEKDEWHSLAAHVLVSDDQALF